MHSYISLLRGINVGGKNKIRMAELRTMYKNLGFKEVESYIQSGNLKFESAETNANALSAKIKKNIKKEFGYDVSVLTITCQQIHQIAKGNPFLEEEGNNIKFLHVTLLDQKPEEQLLESISSFQSGNDKFIIEEDIIYIFTPEGYGKTKLSNTFFERKLKVSATTRNWKTILKLKDMCQN